jgi:hypothetical protein
LTWPVTANLQINPRTVGYVYPWVFGEPGKVGGVGQFSDGVINDLLAFSGVVSTPAYAAEIGLVSGKGTLAGRYLDNYAIIAGHAVDATEVVVSPGADGYAWRLPVVVLEDALGREVSGVRSDQLWAIEPDGEYWVGWPTGGGLDLTGAGDVLRYMLEQAGERVDAGRWASASASLNDYRLDFALSDRVDPHDWAAAHLGELLPLTRRDGPDGVWYEIVPWSTAGPADVVAYLDGSREPGTGEPVERTGRVAWTGAGEVVTRASLRYRRYNGRNYAGAIVSEAGYASDLTERGPIGIRERALTCDVVDDDATAGAMLAAYLAWRSVPRRSLGVAGGLGLLRAELGAVVAYSEAEVSMDREIAIVTGRTIRMSGAALDLTLVERPMLTGYTS